MTPKPCQCRHPREREELVERVIRAERAARIAEVKVRALMADVDGVTALAVRVVELEDIVARQNEKIVALQHRRKTA